MLKIPYNSKLQGFSFVELLIGIAMMTILASLSLPSYKLWIQNTKIRTTAESIQNGLQIARSEAVKRNDQVRFQLGVNSAWSVGCVTVTIDCPSIIQSRMTGEGSSTDITVSTNAEDAIVFNSLGTVNTLPAPFSQLNIDSSESSDDRPLRVTLGVGGNTRMCDPALTGSDPRKC